MGKIKVESSTIATIFVDEKEIGKVAGEIKEFEIENGEHEIHATVSWCECQRLKINVSDDSITTLTLNSFKYENAFRGVMMLFVLLFFLTKSPIFIMLGIITLVYPMYFVTFGRDKYLVLKIKE